MWLKLWQLLRPFWKVFAWFCCLVFFYELLQVVGSFSFSLVISLFEKSVSYEVWFWFFLVLVAFDEILIRLDNLVDWQIIARQFYPLYYFLKTMVFDKFQRLPVSWHEDQNSGATVGKVNHGVDKLTDLLNDLSWEFVPTILQTVLSFIPLLILSPWVVVIIIPSLVVFLWLSIKDNQVRKPLRKERYDLYDRVWHRLVQSVQASETVSVFSQEDRLSREYRDLQSEINRLGCESSRLNVFIYNRWRMRLLSWTRRLILAVWIYQLMQGSLSIANLVYVNVLTEKLLHSFWRFARMYRHATETSEPIERLMGILESPEDRVAQGNYHPNLKSPPLIELKGVSFSYNGDDSTIQDLDLTVSPGEIVAIVGKSGSGKTTLRRLIMGQRGLSGGQILVDKVNVCRWDDSSLRRMFSFVPQGGDVYIFSDTLRSNISFGAPSSSEEDICRAIDLSGLGPFVESLPEGWDTQVGERGVKLSGGQRQRVALARAFLADSSVIFLDEATSSVDVITEKEIQENMPRILKGRTAIIVAHRLSTVWGLADRIVVLHEGVKIAEGSHEELLLICPLYRQMVDLQSDSQ